MKIKAQSDAYYDALIDESKNPSDSEYGWFWTPDPLMPRHDTEFMNMVHESGLLKEERQRKKDYYVLYHYAKGMRLFRDLITILEERKRSKPLPKNFTYVRLPTGSFQSTAKELSIEMGEGYASRERFKKGIMRAKESLDHLTEVDIEVLYDIIRDPNAVKKEKVGDYFRISRIGSAVLSGIGDIEAVDYLSDHTPSASEELIACSPAIYSSEAGESAYYFWKNRGNVHSFDEGELIAQVLDYYGLNIAEHYEELHALQEIIQESDDAIVAFYLPKDKKLIDRSVYIAEPYGHPSEKVKMAASKVFKKLQTEPSSIPDLEYLQMRLVVRDKDLLNPESGVRIKVFDQIAQERLNEYSRRLETWAERLDNPIAVAA